MNKVVCCISSEHLTISEDVQPIIKLKQDLEKRVDCNMCLYT